MLKPIVTYMAMTIQKYKNMMPEKIDTAQNHPEMRINAGLALIVRKLATIEEHVGG
tara:strand:- start:32 stop:199 length:168 start_codon:yes stop_codon:yes gene_type:complete